MMRGIITLTLIIPERRGATRVRRALCLPSRARVVKTAMVGEEIVDLCGTAALAGVGVVHAV